MNVLDRSYRKWQRDGPLRVLLTTFFKLIGDKWSRRLSNAICSVVNNRVQLHGVILDLSHARIGSEIRKSVLTGAYESEERYLIQEHLDRENPVIELGGGIGYISCYVRNIIDSDQEVVVVEADPELVEILKENMHVNGCRLSIRNAAYHPRKERVGFTTGEQVTTGRVEPSSQRMIETIALSDILREFNLSAFTLIADIEGVESILVREELDLLKETCRLIIMEVHGNKSEVEDMLQSNGFEKLGEEGINVIVYRRK